MLKEQKKLKGNVKAISYQGDLAVIEKSTNAGITLVALVVTIVVLLILAGITIAYVLGDNSIFRLAQESKNRIENEIKNEQDGMTNLISKLDENYKEKEENKLDIDDELAKLLKEANMKITVGDMINTPAIMEKLIGLIPVTTEEDVTKEEIEEVITYKDNRGGIIRVSSEGETYYGWKAFDNDLITAAQFDNGLGYLEYEFAESMYVMQIRYVFTNGSSSTGTRKILIQGYDEEKNNWEDLTKELTWTGTLNTKREDIENLDYEKSYKRYRLYVKDATYTSNANGGMDSGLRSMQLYGIKGTTKKEELEKKLLSSSTIEKITLNHMITNKEFTKRLINELSIETVKNNKTLMENLPDLIPVTTEEDVTKEEIEGVITYKDNRGGIIRVSSEDGNYYGWKAFDNNLNTAAFSGGGLAKGYYLEYEFTEPMYAMQIRYIFVNGSSSTGTRKILIKGYDEEKNEWEDLTKELTWTGTNNTRREDIENLDYEKSYKRYRLYVKDATYTSNANGGKVSGLISMQLYGKVAK